MFEANCCRQMGQHKKKIFDQMFLCLHEGDKGSCHVSDAYWLVHDLFVCLCFNVHLTRNCISCNYNHVFVALFTYFIRLAFL